MVKTHWMWMEHWGCFFLRNVPLCCSRVHVALRVRVTPPWRLGKSRLLYDHQMLFAVMRKKITVLKQICFCGLTCLSSWKSDFPKRWKSSQNIGQVHRIRCYTHTHTHSHTRPSATLKNNYTTSEPLRNNKPPFWFTWRPRHKSTLSQRIEL